MGSVENMTQAESMMVVASNSDLPRRRRVFAVRDFPPGCGRFALPTVSRANEVVVCVGTDTNFSAGEIINHLNGNVRCPETVAQTEFKSLDNVLLNGGLNIAAEEPGVLPDRRNGIESVWVEPEVIRQPEALVGSYQVGSVKSEALQHTAWDASNDIRKVGDCAAVAETFQKKKLPVRRSISAVRDFPPFCGKNAPQLDKGEAAEMVSCQENKVFDQDRCNIGEKILKVTEKTDTKEMSRDVDGGDAQEKFSVMSGSQNQNLAVKFKLLPHVPKGTVVLGLMATPNCPGRRKKVHQFGSESEIITKLGGESRGLENLGRELVVCVENNSPVEKLHVRFFSEDQMSVEEKLPECDVMGEIATRSGCDSRLEDVGKEFVTYVEEDRNFDNQRFVPYRKNQKAVETFYGKEEQLPSNESVVQGLMASQTCPWRRRCDMQNNHHTLFSGGIREAVGKKNDFILPSKIYSGKQKKKVENLKGSETKSLSVKECQDMDKMVVLVKEWEAERSPNIGVSIPPISIHAGDKASDNDANVTRNQVRETLRLYQAVVRKLLQQKEAKAKEGGSAARRIDYQAAKILKEKKKYVNTGKPIIGTVPGVEVGDEFHYWVELTIIGLHRPTQAGIDYVKKGQNIIATSIVASGGYDDDTDNSDALIYTGQGGNSMGADKAHMDQKLERGNLALKNSIDEQNPVRVIRGETKESSSPDSRGRGRTYIYDGLYLVQKYWQEIGPHGTLVFKFKLVRIPGQPELAWKAVKRSKKLNAREGLCVDDISQGKEKIPICAVNTIDDQKPPPFKYVTHNIYRDLFDIIPPVGCDCTNGCSESGRCSCVAKNGGEFPYNHDGAIVEAKPLVYECGPRCKCPPSCFNQVSQHGIRFQLEIFKTDTRGWGVRSLNSIPSGSFICEYAGELLKDTEAEQRTGNDEYLFDIGNDYNESSLWDGLSTLVPEVLTSSKEFVEEGCFTIDAAQYGNVGRFVNHSCSPNLYAQNVLYDHGDKRIPHIMLFAAENIPPLQELTYNYNYTMDEVFDSNGNIKKKNCYCGSSECTGRMY